MLSGMANDYGRVELFVESAVTNHLPAHPTRSDRVGILWAPPVNQPHLMEPRRCAFSVVVPSLGNSLSLKSLAFPPGPEA